MKHGKLQCTVFCEEQENSSERLGMKLVPKRAVKPASVIKVVGDEIDIKLNEQTKGLPQSTWHLESVFMTCDMQLDTKQITVEIAHNPEGL